MANYKYKLSELEIGDVTYDKGTKSTVSSIDPETGGITWDIEDIPDFESVFRNLKKTKDFMDTLSKSKDLRGDSTIQKIQQEITNSFNELRTHVRKNYPDEYARIKMVNEESATGGGTAGASFSAFVSNN